MPSWVPPSNASLFFLFARYELYGPYLRAWPSGGLPPPEECSCLSFFAACVVKGCVCPWRIGLLERRTASARALVLSRWNNGSYGAGGNLSTDIGTGDE